MQAAGASHLEPKTREEKGRPIPALAVRALTRGLAFVMTPATASRIFQLFSSSIRGASLLIGSHCDSMRDGH